MKQNLLKFTFGILFMLLAWTNGKAQTNDSIPETVVDIATGDSTFSSLVAALTRSDLTTDFVGILSGEGPFTVFAPTNDAFAALLDELGLASLNDIPVETLDAVLKMHVVAGKVMSTDLSDGMMAPTFLGEEITFHLDGGASISDPNGRMSNITAVDVEAQNGVVHVIDTVILPDLRPETVVEIATGDSTFSSLVAALTRSDLTTDFIGILSGEGPFTVFAPTNDAFADLLNELGLASLNDIPVETLDAVLKMHVVAGKVMSTDLSDGMMAPTVLGEEITFHIDGGASISDPNGRMSNITAVDVEAQNGVVHVIDMVILPDLRPETVVDIATGDSTFSSLVAALTRSDLTTDFVGILSGEGPFTVFAPTNDAFASLLNELGVASLNDIPVETLDAVLKMHVVAGKVMSTDLSDGMMAPTVLGEEITFHINGGASISDPNGRMSNITAVDVEAQNGVVHVIDTVILPDLRPKTVVDIATGDNAFSSLVAALTRSDLTTDFVGILSGEGPFTVFAPTNDAFTALLNELGLASLNDIPVETLDAVLKMHVVAGQVMSTDLSDGMMAPTVLGEEITFHLDGGASITDLNERESNITAVDLEAQNGVVHVIDKVILPDVRPETIVDIAAGDTAFSSLDAALTREDLDIDFLRILRGSGPFTVFAPTNAAFAELLDELGVSSLDELDPRVLEEVLKLHIVSAEIKASAINDYYEAKTIGGQIIMFKVTGGVRVIDPLMREANIQAADVLAKNGRVHVIDKVLLPDLPPLTVVDIATGDPNFSSLVAALTRPDLTIDFVGILSGEGPFTVFAPTNDAFAALLTELGLGSLNDIPVETLEAVLKMHVVAGNVMSTDLSEGMMASTFQGEELTFSLENGAMITDPNGRMSNITAVDLEALNGVVHVIDKVILPDLRPATVVDIATGDPNFSSLVAALTRPDLTIDFVGILSGEGPFTVFAPTNDAFAALLTELGFASLNDIPVETLEAVLKMHVVAGKVMSTDLSEGMMAPTLEGEDLTFSLENGAMITDPNGRMSNITAVDIEAQNGVVHVIDKVILPDLNLTSVNELRDVGFKIYPNPARDFINIQTDETGADIKIMNIAGKVVFHQNLESNLERIDVSSFSPGVYLLTIEMNGLLNTKKIILR
ncbi:fasciclin domain-containing protein [Maribellus sediminis]|uniref:fasciclin domain-containing protein n=1 Tax=Maribellus sediminis TaxID=2696285 RepID=UPI0014320145|nr:fasciclin domain-containing protein [Maribellus sediminis]